MYESNCLDDWLACCTSHCIIKASLCYIAMLIIYIYYIYIYIIWMISLHTGCNDACDL